MRVNNILSGPSLEEMQHSTNFIQLTPDILESVALNLPKNIKSMKTTIHFKALHQMENFKSLQEERSPLNNDDDDLHLSSDQEEAEGDLSGGKEGDGDDLIPKETLKTTKPSKQEPQIKIKPIEWQSDLTFQKSTIIKKYYSEKLNDIARRFGVSISIIPKKVKIIGFSTDSVENVADEYLEISEEIEYHLIHDYGKEIVESQRCRDKLAGVGIKVIEITKQYYYWYLSNSKSKFVKEFDVVTQEVFNTIHALYPLYRIISARSASKSDEKPKYFQKYENMNKKKIDIENQNDKIQLLATKKYYKLLKNTKAKLFELVLRQKLNDLNQEDRWIQLSVSKDNLVIHCDANEMTEIQICNIEELYQDYASFCLTFKNTDYNQQISAILEKNSFKEKDTENKTNLDKIDSKICFDTNFDYFQSCKDLSIFQDYQRNQNGIEQTPIVCLLFRRFEKITSDEEIFKQTIFNVIEQIANVTKQFKISIHYVGPIPNVDSKHFIQLDHYHKVVHILPKTKTISAFKEILKEYVIKNPFSEQESKKTVQESKEQSFTQILVNQSEKIQDSSLMLQNKTILDNSMLNQTHILNVTISPAFSKKKEGTDSMTQTNDLPSAQSPKLINYTIFWPQSENDRSKRCDSNVKQFQNGVISPQKALEAKLKELTEKVFKIYVVRVPKQHQIFDDNNDGEGIGDVKITVYAKSEKNYIKPYNKEADLPVYLIEEKDKDKYLTGIGYLINTKKKNIIEKENHFFLKYGTYEVTKMIKLLA